MGRTLYINSTNKPVITRDGPSIWIREEGRAGRRIPARLVNRVIIIGNVKLDAGSIALFAEYNTPVTFMQNCSEEIAVVLPYNHRLPDHYKEQLIFLESDENREHYEQWAGTKRAILQLNFLRRFLPGLAATLEKRWVGEGNYQQMLIRLRRVDERKWLAVNGIVTGIFRNMIIDRVIDSGLDPHLGVIHRRHNFGLALDICYILGGLSDLQTLQFLRTVKGREFITKEDDRWYVTDAGVRDIVHRYENTRRSLEEKVDNIIDEMFILMREMAS